MMQIQKKRCFVNDFQLNPESLTANLRPVRAAPLPLRKKSLLKCSIAVWYKVLEMINDVSWSTYTNVSESNNSGALIDER